MERLIPEGQVVSVGSYTFADSEHGIVVKGMIQVGEGAYIVDVPTQLAIVDDLRKKAGLQPLAQLLDFLR